MTIRTSKKTVTFRRPFILAELDGVQPAGVYAVETDEELLEGISFPAYRRISTLIRLHAKPDRPGIVQTLYIDPKDLDAALMRDSEPVASPVDRGPLQREPETQGMAPFLKQGRELPANSNHDDREKNVTKT
ncbi:MAG: hypothetical protein H8E39_01150 [Alphaproteobacteria bacterium]|nr:hypothetical protein [Alphaproteobacteria bacterium]